MSALGQKQTFAVHQPMSALPPITTARADFRTRSCLLYPSFYTTKPRGTGMGLSICRSIISAHWGPVVGRGKRTSRHYISVHVARRPARMNVRFGSKADISQCSRHVRFTPDSVFRTQEKQERSGA
jgi:hypothetical protein